ncbi:MAG TPA: hypothetical protein PKU78_02840 [Candidatus Dojkabacteria bacterium]|nr:hypothetical protein [Candidatus Dojkabacteria bacterium]HRO65130.1 hypothetical protein [Candidatus Dojkabacteria bacterium]HRP50780.1 hypothetical protein [Candidatus Dojkabacteria bacterium]
MNEDYKDPFDDLDEEAEGEENNEPEEKKAETKGDKTKPEGKDNPDDRVERLVAKDKVSDFLLEDGNEVYKKHANKILEEAMKPENRTLPIDRVVAIALGPSELVEIGKQMADTNQSNVDRDFFKGSNSSSKGNELGNAWDLSEEDFEKTINQMRIKNAGRY